jgi:protein gp37
VTAPEVAPPVVCDLPPLPLRDPREGELMTTLGPYEVHPFADAFPLIEGEEFDELVRDIKRNGLREPVTLNHDKTVLIDGRNRYRACEAAGIDVACHTLGAHYTETMILDLIVSKNIERRQLNPGQRNALAVEYDEFYAAAMKAEEMARKAVQPRAEAGSSSGGRFTTQDHKPSPADLRETVGQQNVTNVCHCGDDTVGHTHAPAPQPQRRHERESSERAAKIVGGSGRGVQQAKAVKRDAPDLYAKVRSGETALDNAYRQARQRIRDMPKPEKPKPGPVMLTLRTNTGDEVPYSKPQGKATFNETPGEGISWAAWSWNPVTGCLHGCRYCYARDIATSERYKASYPVGFTPLFHHERLDAPGNTTIPAAQRDDPAYRRVFVCSMADLYGRWVPDEWIEQVHASMLGSPEWEYLLLTKFPARYVGLDLPPRAWVGTSVDEQKRVRIAEDAFRQIDGVAVKWLSLEPLREPLQFADLSMFDWVVIGAQTETHQPDGLEPAFAPPFDWVRDIVNTARAAGCKVHCKPNLLGKTDGKHPGMQLPNEYPNPPR